MFLIIVHLLPQATGKAGSRLAGTDPKWQSQIVVWRDELGISPNYMPFDQLELKVSGLKMTNRIRSLLNMVVAEKTKHVKKKTKKSLKSAIRNVVVDISQNPVRRSHTTKDGFAHTLCTGSRLVHLGLGRLVHPKEMLWLQGHNPHSTNFPSNMKVEQIRKLAGEGMALPCLGVCIWAQFLIKGYPDP